MAGLSLTSRAADERELETAIELIEGQLAQKQRRDRCLTMERSVRWTQGRLTAEASARRATTTVSRSPCLDLRPQP
jgi:hypothetical protein